jgi:hypothetical protein
LIFTLNVLIVVGNHLGKKFAELFYNFLEKYNCLDKIHTITADNASTNNKIARKFQLQVPSFNCEKQLLGCIAHVINLAAKAGIAALGCLEDQTEGTEISTTKMGSANETNGTNCAPTSSIMSISALTSRPDGADANFSTILKRIHRLSKFVCFSPQRREQFEKVMDFIQPKMCEKNIKCLKIDVSTCWNYTYSIFKRAILLQKTCTHFCKEDQEVQPYQLSKIEWDQETSPHYLDHFPL